MDSCTWSVTIISIPSRSVFVGARLHVTGGALKDGEAAIAVLDIAAAVWLDRNGLVTSSYGSTNQTEDRLWRSCNVLDIPCHPLVLVYMCMVVLGEVRPHQDTSGTV